MNKSRIVKVWGIGGVCLLSFCINSNCFAISNKTFDATIDFCRKDLSFVVDLNEQGKVLVSGNVEGDTYTINFTLRHLKFGKSDLSTDFYTSGIIVKTKEGLVEAIKGKAWTQTSLLNFKPLKEFLAEYEITKAGLIINSLSWAGLEVKGQITTSDIQAVSLKSFSDAAADLSLTIKEMGLKELAGLLGVSQETVALEGMVSGQVHISGPAGALKIEAELSARDGKVSKVDFKTATINAQGLWPVLRFSSAQINDIGGIIYQLKGRFNLKELADFNSPEHQVTVYSSNNAMRFQDWVIRRGLDSRGQDVVEAEYNLEKNQALKMRIKDQEEIVGLEKSVKF